jgi:ferredoxin-NADP reductase
MENTIQTHLLDAFQHIERLLPHYARTGIFSRSAQQYVAGRSGNYRPVAQVIARRQEATDTISLTLKTPAGYPHFRAGQYIDVAVQIRGVRHVRQYSITSPAADSNLRITVKRQQGGLVSNYLHDHAAEGFAIEISQPKGEFILPEAQRASYVFCSAGSGITPVFALTQQLLASGTQAPIRFLHAARSEDAVIFRAELEHLAEKHANFFPHFFLGEASDFQKRRLNAVGAFSLLETELDVAASAVFLCGPGDFVRELETAFRDRGYSHIATEYYTLPATTGTEEGTVQFLRSGIEVKASGNLLETAEAAGLKPKHGCRRGICHECKAHKTSGTVKNILTGKETAGEENLQLCVSQAVGKVELDL